MRMKSRLYCLLIFCFILLHPVYARNSWGVGAAYHLGFLAAHNTTMFHLLDDHVKGVEVTIFRQTQGKSSWQENYLYPRTGFEFMFLDLPSDTILGNAFSAMAFIDMPVIKTGIYCFSIRSACGLGYLTKHFERVENHKNSAIGSALNAAIQFNFENSFRISSRFDLHFTVGLTHFSNGSFSTPNLGINNVTASGGFRYLIAPADSFYHHPQGAFSREWETEVMGAAGVKEIYPPDNGKYFAATLMASRIKQISNKSKAGFGADVFYDTALETLVKISEKQSNDVAPFRAGAHLSYQLLLNRISAIFDVGVYLLNPYSEQGPLYDRIGLHYHVNDRLFINLSLKTHYAKAEYTEWGIGWKFLKKAS
jgi:hypothetical protein